jgi:hypothetical protein
MAEWQINLMSPEAPSAGGFGNAGPIHLVSGRDPEGKESDTLYDAYGGCNGACDGCGAGDCLPIKTMGILRPCVSPECGDDIFRAASVDAYSAESGFGNDSRPRVEVVGTRQLKVSGVSHFIVVRLPSQKGAKGTSTFTSHQISKPEDWNVQAKEGTVTLVFLPRYKLVNRRWTPIEPKDRPKPPKHLRLVKLAPSTIEWKGQ